MYNTINKDINISNIYGVFFCLSKEKKYYIIISQEMDRNMLEKNTENFKYRNFNQIINTFYNEEVDSINENNLIENNKLEIKLEPIVLYDKLLGNIKIEFKIGKSRMYKIKSITDFYNRIDRKEKFKYKII